MPARIPFQTLSPLLLVTLILFLFTAPTTAFGAGYVSRGSHLKTTNFRHGDIALAIPLLATANRRVVKQIYFGNWLRDFSQLLDRSSLSLVPQPILRALVAVFAFVQFGYATREFEVTDERLGFYRPEEHVDNPRGYESGVGVSEGLRPAVHPSELAVDPSTGMKNYIANTGDVGTFNPTSAEYVSRQLIAAIACGRNGDQEAYIHLGAALHTLEDFVAHSNYVELCMRMIGKEMEEQEGVTPALGKVFAYTGDGAKVQTKRGMAPPIVTGTFGALDLYQTLLGELDDKMNSMSLPGLKVRSSEKGGMLQTMAKSLIGLLSGINPGFEKGILNVQKAALSPHSADWGELNEKPESIWKALEPVFTLRDDIVKWVYDNLTIRAVQDAIAALSTAIDKLVYMVIGVVLGPVFVELSRVLKRQEQELLIEDQEARLATGEQSIFNGESTATDPTHSQLAKDHYDNALNEIAGRVATRISSYTLAQIIPLWQPTCTTDPVPAINAILSTFHHPYNLSKSPIQSLMYTEVSEYVNAALMTSPAPFISTIQKLDKPSIAARIDEEASLPHGHSYVDAMTQTHAPSSIASQTAHDLVTEQRSEVQRGLVERMSLNIESSLSSNKLPGVSLKDLSVIKSLLFAPPSGESPNPLDSGLARLPGVGLLQAFEGISIHEIAAADGMGNTLKDAVVSLRLMDAVEGERAEEVAAKRFGWGKTESEKEERRRLKEMQALLTFEKSKTVQDERQFEEKKGAGEKMREGLGRLKLKVGGKGKDGE